MMKRVWIPILAVCAVAGCDPQVPDSAAGVGFGDYTAYQQQRAAREAQITGAAPIALPAATGAPTPLQVQREPVLTAQADLPPASSVITPAAGADPVIAAAASALDRLPGSDVGRNAGISDEQEFNAVAGRESIESDAERLARQRAQYQAVQPTVLPDRQGDGGPNIVEYALKSKQSVGQSVYARSFGSERRAARNCAAYPSPDKAQQAFLLAGGPERDRKSLDPDGDGFACGWDPRPFRKAVQG